MSNKGNSLVNSEMGNPWSTYVPLSIHSCWLRMMTHRPTGIRALSGAHSLRPNTGQTGGCTLRSLDSCLGSNSDSDTSTYCPFPTKHHYHYHMLLHCLTLNTTSIWTAYIVLYQTEAVTLSFTYTSTGAGSSSMPASFSTIQIFIKTINSGANLHPCLGSPKVKISSSHPSWLLSVTGCATRYGMPGCLFWLLACYMRLCALISRYISCIHLGIRHISRMPSPHRKPCLAISTVLSQNERLFNKNRCLIIIQIETGISSDTLQTRLWLWNRHRSRFSGWNSILWRWPWAVYCPLSGSRSSRNWSYRC